MIDAMFCCNHGCKYLLATWTFLGLCCLAPPSRAQQVTSNSLNGGRDPKIDYLAFHWYDYGLESQLNRLQKYGKQTWITEMANWNAQIDTYEKQAAQMRQVVPLCESRDDVFRYAWFIGRRSYPDNKHTYLFDSDPGQLNDLGKLYISLPYSN